MTKKRTCYSAQYELRVALDAAKGLKPQNELGSEPDSGALLTSLHSPSGGLFLLFFLVERNNQCDSCALAGHRIDGELAI